MPKVALLNIKGEKVKDIKVEDSIFGIEPNDAVVYDAVVLAGASMRQGTHDTKGRSEVSGGGKKPWRQKGTGRARQGSIRAPQWRGGGIVFGPTPRDYSKKQNKKERKLALLSVLSSKATEKELFVLESLSFESGKTKEALNILANLKLTGTTLVVVEELTDEAILAFRNLRNVKVIAVDEVNTIDVITYKNLLITETAVKKLEEVLA